MQGPHSSSELTCRSAAAAGAVCHVLGLCLGLYLWQHRTAVAAALQGSGLAFATWLAPLIVWLMGAPAGLKLHGELSSVLGGAALGLLYHTHRVYALVLPAALPHVLGALTYVMASQTRRIFGPVSLTSARHTANAARLGAEGAARQYCCCC